MRKNRNQNILPWVLAGLLLVLIVLDLVAQIYNLQDQIIIRSIDMLIVAISLVVGYYFKKK